MALDLRNAGISTQVSVEPMHEAAFDEFLEGMKKQVGGSIFEVRRMLRALWLDQSPPMAS